MGRCLPDPVAIRTFGKRLRRFAYRNQDLLANHISGWTEGGCAVFAKALRIWAGRHSTMRTLIRHGEGDPRSGVLDHVVVKIGPYYLDGAGANTKQELIRRTLDYYELCGLVDFYPDDFSIRPTTSADFRRADASRPWCPAHAVQGLAAKMVKEFGQDPKPWICPGTTKGRPR